MSNFQKSFSFRNGVQVDTDDLVVRGGLVGIGTTVPTEILDVRGTTKVVGLVTAQQLHVSGISTLATRLDIGLGGQVSIANGIVTSTTGVVTYYGDGGNLLNLPTSQWIDVDPTFAYESIYASGPVGIATTNPEYFFQIGNNPDVGGGVGFNTRGNIKATGIVTAASFVGSGSGITQINASNITSGTISNSYLPVINNDRLPTNIDKPTGIVTASQFVGYLTGGVAGIATLARGLTDTPGISVGILTATSLDLNGNGDISGDATISGTLTVSNDVNIGGITTVAEVLNVGTNAFVGGSLDVTGSVFAEDISLNGAYFSEDSLSVGSNAQLFAVLSNGNVGLGTSIPSANLQLIDEDIADIDVISQNSIARVSVGQSIGIGNSTATFAYDAKTLKITNYDVGGVNVTLHAGTGTGTTEGFKVRYNNTNVLNVTYDGRLSIGKEVPDGNYTLDVDGSSYIAGNQVVVGIITIGQGGNKVTFGDGSPFPIPQTQNFDTVTGISTFNKMNVRDTLSVGSTATLSTNLDVVGKIGIGTTNNTNYSLRSEGSAFFSQEIITKDSVLISDQPEPTLLSDPRNIPNTEPYSSWVPYLDYGNLQVENKGVGFISQQLLIVPYVGVTTGATWGGGVGYGDTLGITFGGQFQSQKYLSKVGLNTFFPRAVLDVGTASTTMNSYILPPRVTNADLDIIRQRVDKYTPEGTPAGSFLFNISNNRLEVGIGTTTFCGIVTLTNNHSGYYSLVTPIVNSTGRSGLAGTSVGAIVYNSDAGVHQGYGSNGWVDLTNGGFVSIAGVATYAPLAGVATYATRAGVSTYTPLAGVATYAPLAGIASYSPLAGVATYAPTAGIATALNVDSSVNTTGILTASILSTGSLGSGIRIDGTTITGPSILTIDPAVVGDDTGSVRIRGNLVVDGTQTVISSTTLEVADFNVGIATTVGSLALLDGAGIGIGSATIRRTMVWDNANAAFKFSDNINVDTAKVYEIAGTTVLSSNALGSGVVNSSLTSVGTLIKLDVGNINSSGIITATQFVGSFSGTASTAVYASKAGVATYSSIAGVSTYASLAGVATYAPLAGVSTYASLAGVATYAPLAGVATYAPLAGVSTYAVVAGVATYAPLAGVATYAPTAGIATNATIAGYAVTAGISTVAQGLTGTPNIQVGIITATNVVIGAATTQLIVTGNARVTGILTIGTGSITLNGANDFVRVGAGISINGATGVITATTFSGNATSANSAATATFASSAENANNATTATNLTASSSVSTIGIITATGGFSGALGGKPVIITVATGAGSSAITFNVVGVGSTTLRLY